MNGLLQFQVNASSATREQDITREGEYIGKMLGRQIPEEPTYIMLNIDLATRWGWPDSNSEFCDCCSDCRDPKCTTCYYPWDPQNNARQWLADLCTTLPASYDIDYVRVWQKPGNTRTSCDPADYPTQGWIESHRDRYLLPNMNEPLRPVLAGGSQCASDDDCGTALRGHCNNSTGTCQCKAEWTGPKCVARRIGTALTCCALESESIGGAACYVNSSTACGVSSGRGQCSRQLALAEAMQPTKHTSCQMAVGRRQVAEMDGASAKQVGKELRVTCPLPLAVQILFPILLGWVLTWKPLSKRCATAAFQPI